MSIEDDGLLLNFAGDGASSSVAGRRGGANARGRRQLQRGGRASGGTGARVQQRDVSSSRSTVADAQAPTAARALSSQPVNAAGPSWRPAEASASHSTASRPSPQSDAQAHRNRPPSTSQPPRSGHRTADVDNQNAGAPRRSAGGVISSLFTGDDALLDDQDTKTDAQIELRRAPTNAPTLDSAFPALGLDTLLSAHLASDKFGIKRPTSIQRTALPFLLEPRASKSAGGHVQRDTLLHAQTGSGKTMCYLLPIIQSLLPLCETSWIDRSCLGTLAIILAPTRELAHQIYEVAASLVNLSLASSTAKSNARDDVIAAAKSPNEDDEGTAATVRRTRWIVPGLLSGGATKNHEKSRLRKGLPLIVATPGRLLDHLRNTASLDVGRLQWLVLDEADRLLEMGFEQTLSDIMKAIDGRRRSACEVQRTRMRDELGNQATGEAISDEQVIDTFGEAWWRHSRRTILCSATLDEGVQVLAGKSLNNPRIIRDDGKVQQASNGSSKDEEDASEIPLHKTYIAAPGQLDQNYVLVPPKQRLVALTALLRRAIAAGPQTKIMVFLSCTDSVDFHLQVLAGVNMARGVGLPGHEEQGSIPVDMSKHEHTSQLLPATSLFRLHGSLSQQERQTSLRHFAKCKQASVLFCTSVASRGLDLDVSHVVQLDAPTEKGADEYLHRIGRTARAGAEGESWLVVLPSEEACIAHYEGEMGSRSEAGAASSSASDSSGAMTKPVIHRRDVASVLRDGFSGGGGSSSSDMLQTQTRATDAQMALERWTLAAEGNAQLARRAYLSHLRAYATHPPSERAIFAIARLQLGHLAKAFALREAPGDIRSKAQAAAARAAKEKKTAAAAGAKRKREQDGAAVVRAEADGGVDSDSDTDDGQGRYRDSALQFARNADTEARMYAKVRAMGTTHKRKGVLGAHGGADEFQIA